MNIYKNIIRTFSILGIILTISFLFIACKSKRIVSIVITPTNSTLYVQDTLQYKAIVTYSDGSNEDVTKYAKWESSNKRVAVIGNNFNNFALSKNGLVIALSLGFTEITANFQEHESAPAILTVAPKFAYIANGIGDYLVQCNVNTTSGELYNCTQVGIYPTGNYPVDLVVSNIGTQTFSYVTNNLQGTGTTVDQCSVNPDTGVFTECNIVPFSFDTGPAGIALNTLPDGKKSAYIVKNSTGDVSKCLIDDATGNFITCVNAFENATVPPNLALITFKLTMHGNEQHTFVYLPAGLKTQPSFEFFNIVEKCILNEQGFISDCSPQTTTDIPASGSMGIDFAHFNKETYAYITQGSANFGGTGKFISRCKVNTIDGSLQDCVNAGGSGFVAPWDIKILVINAKQFVYVSNFNPFSGGSTIVNQCEIDSISKNLINCTDTGSQFLGPIGIAFY